MYDGIITPEQYLEERRKDRKVPSSNYIYPSTDLQSDLNRGSVWECATCGSAVTKSRANQHDAFHATFTNRSDGNMSKVLWCDPGDHDFKANAPGSTHFVGTMIDNDGKQITVDQDACRLHNPYAQKDDDLDRRALTSIEHKTLLKESEPYL